MNIYGQECAYPNPEVRECFPKNDADWEIYIRHFIEPQIEDSIIAKNFAEAEIVFEGQILGKPQESSNKQLIYEVVPYILFKGEMTKAHTIKIIFNADVMGGTTNKFWPWPHGIYFVKKHEQNSNIYEFVSTNQIKYGFHISPVAMEKNLDKIVYQKLKYIGGKNYQKTPFFYKKKEKITKIANSEAVIDSLSKDTIPSGHLLNQNSILNIYGHNLASGLNQQSIWLRNANNGGTTTFPIHPDKHVIYWTDDSIQIILPSLGYISSIWGNNLNTCTGSGYLGIKKSYDGQTIYSPETEDFIVPYAIKNFATNDADEDLYTPYELRLRAANGSGGYTIAYDNSFSNHPNALAAFRRALETWRCVARVDFKELCNANNSFCTEDISANTIIVSFKKPCLTYAGGALGKTTITNPTVGCNGNFFTDKMSMIFKDSTSMLPYKWNFSNNANTDTAEFNFEAVATHELGHLLMLGHVLDTTALMYWEGKHGIGAIANNTVPDSSALTAIRYIMGRDSVTTPDCPTQPLLPKSCGGGKTQDVPPCFVDLRMRDNNWDTGQEPNYSAGVDVDGGGWSPTSPTDWEDIWNSPDLWNCKEEECQPENWHNPIAVLPNKLGFTIYNAHPDIVSDEAKLHLYYTMASTGEMWK